MRLKMLSSRDQKHSFPMISNCSSKFPFIFVVVVVVYRRKESEGSLKGILGYTEEDVVSTDFVGDNR